MHPRPTLLLALALAGASLLSPAAYAQSEEERKAREERRTLKADDFDESANQSEEFRRLAREKRHQEMDFAKELLSSGKVEGESKADLMLRLADLYFEEGRDIYLEEMRVFEGEYDKCFETKGCSTETLKPNNTESRKWQEKSIKLYRTILSSYPTFARADEATYYLASALLDIGQKEDALKEFTNLVKTYPESQYVPDAYVQIGEYYFEGDNAYKALLAYQKAAAYRDSSKYAFAMYKLSWCYYNVGEYGKAIDTMKAVVQYSMTAEQQGSGSKSNIQLQEEALKDLVRFFADAGEMDEAYAYFNKLGKKDLISSMLMRLASTYFEQGKFEQCVQTYRRLIAEDPNSPKAPSYQNEVIAAYLKIGKKDLTLNEIDRMLKTYGRSSAWARANASNTDALAEAERYIDKNLRQVALDYHAEAKKLGGGKQAMETYSLAYTAYTVYLNEFPSGQHTYDMRYNFGELLYTLKKYDEAYDQYMKVVEIDPKGKNSQFCAESAFFAAEQMVKKEEKEGKIQKADKSNKTQALDLSEWETKMLTALDQYAKLYPESDKTRGFIYKSGYLYYSKNRFKDASDRFRTVITMDPKSKDAMTAAELILDAFALLEDWSNLKEVSKAFYDQPNLGNAEFKKDTYNIYERASFKLIEEGLKKDNDKAKAAEAFMAFHNEFPSSEVGDIALNNAAAYFFELKRRAEATAARLILIEKYPNSKYYNDNIASLGFDYESMGNFAESASWYEKLFTRDVNHPGSADAIYSAALFRRALGEHDKAVENFRKYLKAYPTKENLNEVRLDIGKIFEDTQKWDQAATVYLDFFSQKDTSKIAPDQLMYARLRYGKCLEAQKQTAKAEKHYQESVEWFKKAQTGGAQFTLGIEFVAEMMYILAEKQFAEYDKLEISGPKSKVPRAQEDKILADNLKKKVAALQQIEATYAAIINTGAGEWGLAALIRLGQVYEDFSESLMGSHMPSYLTEDQREFYRMTLEDRSYQQTSKAVEAYSSALQKSFELNLYNDQTAFATRRLGQLRPDDYPALEEGLLQPGYTSASRKTASFETSF